MFDKMTILAVDDVEMNLAMVRIMLGSLGDLDYLTALNGRDALEILQATPAVDIVLLDLEMPVMDGFELLRIMKQHESLREIPVIVITADRTEVIRTLAMGANDFMVKPYDLEELRLRVLNHVRSKKLSELARDMNSVLEAEVVKKTSALCKALDLSRKAEFEISLRLGMAAEFRDKETGMHIRRISELSHALALRAGLDIQECEILRHAATLHDVGKIGIPDSILLKPGKLDEAEVEIMRNHTVIGSRILAEADDYPVIKAGQIVALQHHEKWDGSGYPHGLAGTGIHIFGRIVMIVDVFDALTSDRPYKKAFSIDKTMEIMRQDRGSFFDPELLDIFTGDLDAFISIQEEFRDEPAQDYASDGAGSFLPVMCRSVPKDQ
jgi:putative two-component system response regulator